MQCPFVKPKLYLRRKQHFSKMWGATAVEEAPAVADPKDTVRPRTPRQYPNIWPDMRPKPPPREIIHDDEHFSDLAFKYRVSWLHPVLAKTLHSVTHRRHTQHISAPPEFVCKR